MPYITQARRRELDDNPIPLTAGELNYMITDLIVHYWKYADPSYQRINDILGALEGAKLEFVRRIVNNYENQKAIVNGDCY